MRKFYKILLFAMVILSVLLMSACGKGLGSVPIMESSFDTITPANSTDEKVLYINNDTEKLVLFADIKIDSGSAKIIVLDLAENKEIFSKSCNEDGKFEIELNNLKAQVEYKIVLSTIEAKKVKLTVTADANSFK